MMNTRRYALGALIIGIVALTSTFAVLRMRSGLKYTPPPENARIVDETLRAYRDSTYVPIDDIVTLTSVLEAAPVYSVLDVEHSELDPRSRATLASVISEWLASRSDGDAETYGAWMRSRGYTPKPLTATDRRLISKRFNLRTGRNITPSDAPWDIFKASFEHEMSDGREPGPTSAIATGADAIEVQFTQIISVDDVPNAFTPLLMELVNSSELPADMTKVVWGNGLERLHWYFYFASSDGSSHWEPPISLAQIIDRDGHAMIARALFMQRTNKNRMIPTIMTMYSDPSHSDWHIHSITYKFVSMDTITGGPEY